jgi:SAM-dependent methyltransferase
MSKIVKFTGLIPQHYDDLLTPFVFDGFSADLVSRIDFSSANKVLELASGTGSVTRRLLEHLPPNGHLTATDLQPDMVNVAKQHVTAANVSWEVADMMNIPFQDEQFDLVVCQFGVMLVPDKLKALSEIHRVLKKGGRLVFSVWAEIHNNPIWDISGSFLAGILGVNPILRDPGPFALSSETDTLALIKQAGFANVQSFLVNKKGEAPTASVAAKGFLYGLPVFGNNVPEDIEPIEKELTSLLGEKLGSEPLVSPLQAWVYQAVK